MILCIDSSVLVEGDWRLQGSTAEALLAASARGTLTIVVPEIVIREVANKHRELEPLTLEKYRRIASKVRALQGADALKAAPLAVSTNYESTLRARLEASRVSVVPFPEISHEDVVARALVRKRPFDRAGRTGYRDALIWENVLQLAERAPVVFAAANPRDFASDSDGDRLHEDLVDDLRAAGLSDDRVRLSDSLDAAASLLLESAQDVLELLNQKLAEDRAFETDLNEQLEAAVAFPLMADEDDVDVELPSEVEELEHDIVSMELEELTGLGAPSFDEAWKLTDDEFTVAIETSAVAHFRVEITTPEFWRHPERIPLGIELSEDDRGAWVYGFAHVIATFDARYRTDTDVLRDIDLWFIRNH